MENWRRLAACHGQDPNLFHPGRGEVRKQQEAKAICASCPVTEPCLEFALGRVAFEDHGVWGGTSERERRRIRRARGVHVALVA